MLKNPKKLVITVLKLNFVDKKKKIPNLEKRTLQNLNQLPWKHQVPNTFHVVPNCFRIDFKVWQLLLRY